MNKVKEQKVHPLDEMEEKEAYRFLTEPLSNLSPEEEYAVRHEDYVLKMPQSGERIRGRENMRAFQESYSTSSLSDPMRRIRVRRVLVREGLWVVKGVTDYGGAPALDVVMICELRDGKIWRDRWYFAEPFEVSEWRARWVERIKTAAQPR
jgi:SnoaL-like domain